MNHNLPWTQNHTRKNTSPFFRKPHWVLITTVSSPVCVMLRACWRSLCIVGRAHRLTQQPGQLRVSHEYAEIVPFFFRHFFPCKSNKPKRSITLLVRLVLFLASICRC